jgi:hypothetical protein
MTLIVKPDYTNIWSSGGGTVAPANTKIQQGWTAEVPPFQYENWIQNRQDTFLAHINQRGIPAWDALTEYEAGSLSYVQGTDGKIYKSVAASGPSTTTQNPVTDAVDTYWTVAFADSNAGFITQAQGDAAYLLKANNLSGLTNVVTARANLGVEASGSTVTKDSSTGAANIPVGTTAQRPTGVSGKLRYNSSTGRFEGYTAAAWGSLGGATGGGNDDVFYENSQIVTTNYTLTAGKNASTAGPVTINTGVTITIPTGAAWVVV